MKNLVIVESPSKSKTIEKYLGKDYKVVSSLGHIRDLTTAKGGLGVDIENDFKPDYAILKDKKQLVSDLKKNAKDASNIYLATDPDREGEAISWHLSQVLGLDINDANRIEFHEITKKAVLEALKNPRPINMGLVHSQETRRILDRIIGFKLSKLLQNKIKSKSAGRVQSIAMRLICDREKEIQAFVPKEYWTIDAIFEHDNEEFKASLAKINGEKAVINNETEANDILAIIHNPFIVENIDRQVKKRFSRLPFITSTLQQEASSKLGFSAKKTMMIAQVLYEGIDLGDETQGLISYMRTDSTRLSDDFVRNTLQMIKNEYGKRYVGSYRVKNDAGSQDAHEAIRPTNIENTPAKVKPYLTNDQYKLYKLIYARTVASLMAPVESDTVTYSLKNDDLLFTANGSVMTFDGFLKVYKDYDSSKDVNLPELELNEELTYKSIEHEQHFTEAPSRYTEAKLIKALEEEGVGRPSTYATVIDTIIKRAYVEHKKASENSKTKYFYPTEQGILTDEMLREYFSSVINIKYTAEMEKELDEIALGQIDYVGALRDFYDRFIPLVDYAYANMEKKEAEKTGELCPECGGELVYRQSRYGKFISCINYPKCHYTKSIKSEDKFEPEHTGKVCPDCGGELLKRKSRYGNFFLGCSNYPKCKHIENIEGEEKPKFIRKKGSKKKSK